jgi:hypothetical protein
MGGNLFRRRGLAIAPIAHFRGEPRGVSASLVFGEVVMIHSRDRILTTHVDSLPRNEVLTGLLIRREAGEAIDGAMMAAEMDRAVRSIVDAQVAAGIDIGNDGEQQRVGFQTYIPEGISTP